MERGLGRRAGGREREGAGGGGGEGQGERDEGEGEEETGGEGDEGRGGEVGGASERRELLQEVVERDAGIHELEFCPRPRPDRRIVLPRPHRRRPPQPPPRLPPLPPPCSPSARKAFRPFTPAVAWGPGGVGGRGGACAWGAPRAQPGSWRDLSQALRAASDEQLAPVGRTHCGYRGARGREGAGGGGGEGEEGESDLFKRCGNPFNSSLSLPLDLPPPPFFSSLRLCVSL